MEISGMPSIKDWFIWIGQLATRLHLELLRVWLTSIMVFCHLSFTEISSQPTSSLMSITSPRLQTLALPKFCKLEEAKIPLLQLLQAPMVTWLLVNIFSSNSLYYFLNIKVAIIENFSILSQKTNTFKTAEWLNLNQFQYSVKGKKKKKSRSILYPMFWLIYHPNSCNRIRLFVKSNNQVWCLQFWSSVNGANNWEETSRGWFWRQ